MADPTIQTFCCHRPNRTDSPVNVLMEFHSDMYNTVCVVSSILGILGAIYQIIPRHNANMFRSFYFSRVRGRQIIVWLAVADLMASLGVFTRSILWIYVKGLVPALSDGLPSVVFCAVSSAWIQFFYTATWFWTLCYALEVRRMLKGQGERAICYHVTAWLGPALLTSLGLVILYVPDANCHSINTLHGALTRILPNYCATLLPVTVIMIANPILYCCSTRDVEFNIAVRLGQVTQKERDIADGIKIKFFIITMAFYLCWLPNIVCGILIWSLWIDLPKNIIVVLWYIMAVMNPLQALLNSLVYRRWTGGAEHIHLPYLPCGEPATTHGTVQTPSLPIGPAQGEDTPLLQSHNEGASINGSSQHS